MLEWPFFEQRHRDLAWQVPNVTGDGRSTSAAARSCAAWPTAGCEHTVARAARRAHALPRARDARLPRRARGLRVRHAGARRRADHAVRRRRAARARYLPAVAAGEKIAAFALSEPEAGSDVAAMKTMARRRSHHRREDLDLQRRDRRLLHRLRARTRGHQRLRGRRRARRGRRAHRRDRAAPARDAALRRRAGDADRPARARGCAWRSARSTCSARPSAPRRWGSRGGRWTRRSRA